MRSEIQNQLAGLLINVLFLPQYKPPNVQLPPLTMSSLKNTCFQNNICPETTLREFTISLVHVITCEPVNVETESRNFTLKKCSVFTDANKTIIPVSIFLPKCIYIYRDIAVLIDGRSNCT